MQPKHHRVGGESDETGKMQGWYSRGYLPHFNSPVHVQHVTVHLADSLPKSAIDCIDSQLECISEEERVIERRKRLHEWIDAGHGSCILQEQELGDVVQEAFHSFDGERYRLFAWVVMPNHFHVLFQPMDAWTLSKIVGSWKRYTATEIKKWLRARQESGDPGRNTLPCGPSSEPSFLSGELPIWPREYWDRYIRNEKHFNAVIDYIHYNLVKAGLCKQPESWRYSRAYKS